MTERKLLTLDDFVTKPTTYTRFGQKVTKNPIQQIYDAGLLSEYKQLTVSHKYLRFSGMFEEGDGGEGIYFQDNSITDDEDIGVIIYIGENKYRRLWGAYVLVDWFYTGDFGIALQRACKYASVRCIPGKTYECNSSITLKLDVRGSNGIIDYGHVLIDLSGATINYTAENTSFCFNIRIYHRDTKFMLTNGTFNVSDSAKITLKNIANIVGGNNYTDMLTNMTYNVEQELQPDTNRVVLITDPTMEGIKTFNTLNYVGDKVSDSDKQAVTKEYKVAFNEDAYLQISDSRIIPGITKFDNLIIYDSNIQRSDIDFTRFEDLFFQYLSAEVISIYPVYSTYVYINDIVLLGTYEDTIENTDEYKVALRAPSTTAVLQPQCIIDENDIGIPVYLKCVFTTSLELENPVIVEEDNVELKDEADSTIYTTGAYADLSSNLFVKASIKGPILGKVVDDNIIYVAILTNTNYEVTYTNLVVFYSNTTPYMVTAAFSYTKGFTTSKSVTETSQVHITPTITIGTTSYKIKILGYTADMYHFNLQSYSLSYAYALTNKYTLVIDTGKVKRLDNIPMKIANMAITGAEYISINTPVTFYIDKYTEVNNKIIFDTIFIKLFVPVQANLVGANIKEHIKPCSTIKLELLYNSELISTSTSNIYIARFISNGQPAYEVPIGVSVDYTTTNRYPLYKLYTNNWINPITYKFSFICNISDNGVYIDKRIERVVNCDKPRCCSDCRCPCNTRYGEITGNPNGDTKIGHSLYCGTYTKNYTFTYNTYIYGCSSSEGIQGNGRFKSSSFNNGIEVYRPWHSTLGCNGPYISTGLTNDPKHKITTTVVNYTLPVLQHGQTHYIKQYFISHYKKAEYTEQQVPCAIKLASESPACSNGCTQLNTSITTYRQTRYYNAIFTGVFKNRLFDRVFGRECYTNNILLRDGVLSDPFRNRHLAIEHAQSLPVGVF